MTSLTWDIAIQQNFAVVVKAHAESGGKRGREGLVMPSTSTTLGADGCVVSSDY